MERGRGRLATRVRGKIAWEVCLRTPWMTLWFRLDRGEMDILGDTEGSWGVCRIQGVGP